MSENNARKHWRQRYRPYILAVILAFVMTMLVMPEVMDDKSMSPTISEHNLVVCTKTTYSAKRGAPSIGEVVVLEKVATEGVFEDNLISRVVAGHGDTIEIKGGTFYRNGEAVDLKQGKGNFLEDRKKITLEKNQVYLLSDNREEGIDSRDEDIGPVDMEHIKGNVKIILWPIADFGKVK